MKPKKKEKRKSIMVRKNIFTRKAKAKAKKEKEKKKKKNTKNTKKQQERKTKRDFTTMTCTEKTEGFWRTTRCWTSFRRCTMRWRLHGWTKSLRRRRSWSTRR